MQKVTIELDNYKNTIAGVRGRLLESSTPVLLLLVLFLLPIFFVPSVEVSFQFSKMLLLSIVVLTTFVLWIIARLKDGKFVFPKTSLLLASGGILVVTLVSALFSGVAKTALVGQTLDVGTAGSLGVMFLLLFLVSCVFKSKDQIFYAYLVFLAAFFLIAAFQILRLIFGASFLSFGIFTDPAFNAVGKWNDLGIFFGIGAVLSLVTLELILLPKLFKALAYGVLATSLFFMAIVNFTPIWYVTTFFGLIFLVYLISFDRSDEASAVNPANQDSHVIPPHNPAEVNLANSENQSHSSADVRVHLPSSEEQRISSFRKIPQVSLIVLIISLTFILGGNSIGEAISNKFNIAQIEARPSWGATFDVAKKVLAVDPILGAGPNRFTQKWLLYKPDGINTTVFWNTDFNFGIGFVPTLLVTTGLLGSTLWVLFLGLFLYVGFRSILSVVDDKVSRYLVTSSFMVSLFLWMTNVFYIPSMTIVMLTFFFTGLFIASLSLSGAIQTKTISFINDPKKVFVSVLVLILLLISAIASGYYIVEKFMASVYFQKGVVKFNKEGNIDSAEKYLLKAVELDNDSSYYRSLVQIDAIRLSTLFSQDTKTISREVMQSRFQTLFSSALNHAEQAVTLGSDDYQNWISLGQVYELIVPLKIPNVSAYESAHNAYQQALNRNPKSPAILLTLARLEVAHDDNAKAKDYIGQALQQKNNYTDAIFLLAQIQVQEGNIKDAISSVEAAVILSPNDSGIFFQLGLLRYNIKDFKGAASAFEQAVTLNSSYANAKYFLGLAYAELGRSQEAIVQFKDLQTTNPDSQEIKLILSNLTAGRAAFAGATAPIDNKPEKRQALPVSEKGDTAKTK